MEIDLDGALAARVSTARRLAVLTGAGVSRESGIATFRDAIDGLWERFRPEELATPQAFRRHPGVVWRWYAWRYRVVAAAAPNPAHHALARLAGRFPFFTLVTQNVDGLHQQAGSRGVLELHGNLRRARCEGCGERSDMGKAIERSPEEPPRCTCGGRLRPDVVWFGEALPQTALSAGIEAARQCDLFLSVGTSSQVFPAAGLIEVAHAGGAAVIEVNPAATGFSALAALRLAAPAGEALPALEEALARCRPTPS